MTEIIIQKELNSINIVDIIEILNNIKVSQDLMINFSQNKFVYPGGITTLMTYLLDLKESLKGKIKYNSNQELKCLLTSLESFNLIATNSQSIENIYLSKDKFSEPYHFSVSSKEQDVQRQKEKIMRIFTRNTNNINYKHSIDWCIPELVDNAYNHSEAELCLLFAKYFESIGFTEFCISDRGIGIKASMGEENIITALQKCIQFKTKGKNSSGFGNGLFYTSELIKNEPINNKSMLTIFSEDALLNIYSGKEPQISKTKAFWKGTVVTLRLDNNIQKDISELLGHKPYGIEDLENYNDIF